MQLNAGITAAAIVAMAAFSFSGTADAFPDKPVQLTVGFYPWWTIRYRRTLYAETFQSGDRTTAKHHK